MPKLFNSKNVPLSVAAWLATDTYDFKANSNSLSSTDLTKSIRQVILRSRCADASEERIVDISDLIKSRIGTACHDAIENFWTSPEKVKTGLLNLGHDLAIVERVIVNPDPKELTPESIPVYLEQRGSIEIDGYTISGKFDFVAEGRLTDFKTTGTWKWAKLDEADEAYRIQGSIYRLIHQDIIKDDVMNIVFIFTDWMAGRATSGAYPPSQCITHTVKLMSLEETERFIKRYIAELDHYKDIDEDQIPACNSIQLWQNKPTYKYYRTKGSKGRATKVFDNFAQAHAHYLSNGSVGEVRTIYGEARACHSCAGASMCSQRLSLISAGLLRTQS